MLGEAWPCSGHSLGLFGDSVQGPENGQWLAWSEEGSGAWVAKGSERAGEPGLGYLSLGVPEPAGESSGWGSVAGTQSGQSLR